MAKNKSPLKGANSRQGRGQAAAGSGNRTVTLALAGFTAVAILGIAIFAIASSTGGSSGSFTPNDEGLIPVGQQAPDFSAQTVDGGDVSLSGGNSQATLLVFFASWCPHCQNEAPLISDLEQQYGNDLQVIMAGIDQNGVPSQNVPADDPQAVRQFVENYGIEGAAIYQPQLGQDYGVSGYPTAYVLDENRTVVGASAGEVPEDVLNGWVEEALGQN